MGNDQTKKKGKENTACPKIVPKGRNLDDTKHIRLLVLHDKSHPEPRDVVDHFCDAVNAFKPPGSLEIKPSNVKILQLAESDLDPSGPSSLSISQRKEVKEWISEWLKQNGVVLICLLTNHNVQPFTEDINLQDGKVVAFSLGKQQPAAWKGSVGLGIDLDTITSPRDFEAPLEELVATVKAE